jgi:predicted DNA-binding transcriptional regulator YafY
MSKVKKRNPVNRIRQAMKSEKLVRIKYQCGTHGKHESKLIEPYSFKDGTVFGWDWKHNNGIRQYRLDRINSASIPRRIPVRNSKTGRTRPNSFKPRWDIEPGEDGEHE